MVAATCVFEGTKVEVDDCAGRLYAIAQQFGGVPSGEENGRYGYRLTFAIAYLRVGFFLFGLIKMQKIVFKYI